MDEAELQGLIDILGPEGMQALMDSGLMDERLGMAGQQMKMGAGQFGAPSAAGQNVGGTYVAANPLEHVATAMTRAMGLKQMQGAQDSQAQILARAMDAKNRLARGMALQGQPMMGPEEPPTFGPGY